MDITTAAFPQRTRAVLGNPLFTGVLRSSTLILIEQDISVVQADVETYRNRRVTHSPVPSITVESVARIQTKSSRVTTVVPVSIYTNGTT